MVGSEFGVRSSEQLLRTPRYQLRTTVALCAILLFEGAGCASWPRRLSERPCCIDSKPVLHHAPIWWHLFDVTVLEPVEQVFHLVRPMRKLAGVPVRAANLREGAVADSAFFTNRDPASLSPEAVRWGPTRPDDEPRPPFRVTKAKTEGKTAGFFVKDARGVAYLFKLDPVDAPELLSGAETVTSKLLYALGYHVPSYEVLMVRPEDLALALGATSKDRTGAKVSLDEAVLRTLLEDRVIEGRVRVVASRILDGDVLGPAKFKQFRDCADMRALKLAYAWVNNIDTKDHNSLLVWNGTETVGYLIDFGTSLGADAGAAGPKSPCAGWLNIVDLHEALLKTVTFGLHHAPCDFSSPMVSPGIGRFSPHFAPEKWKPYAPNLAFHEMNADDAHWMAGRMNRLSKAQTEAAVSAGQYSDPRDAAYLVGALEERREAILRRYLDEEEEEPEEPNT